MGFIISKILSMIAWNLKLWQNASQCSSGADLYLCWLIAWMIAWPPSALSTFPCVSGCSKLEKRVQSLFLFVQWGQNLKTFLSSGGRLRGVCQQSRAAEGFLTTSFRKKQRNCTVVCWNETCTLWGCTKAFFGHHPLPSLGKIYCLNWLFVFTHFLLNCKKFAMYFPKTGGGSFAIQKNSLRIG